MVTPTITIWSTLIGAVRRMSRGSAEELIGREAYDKQDLFVLRNDVVFVAAGLQACLHGLARIAVEFPAGGRLIEPDASGRDGGARVALGPDRRACHASQHGEL